MSISAIPDGYHTVTPHLVVDEVGQLVDFLRAAFDATECYRAEQPDGRLSHARVQIGTSIVMVGRSTPDFPAREQELYLYVEDSDAVYEQAMAAGATSVQTPADQSYGDRVGGVLDPQRNLWWIGTRIELVSPEEYVRRAGSIPS